MIFDETTPHSADAESALLSIALQWPDHIDRIEAHPCGTNLFFIPGNRDIYAAALAMRSEQKQIEIGTLSVALESSGRLDPAGGRLRLAELFTDAPSPALADQYLESCAGLARRRSLISTLNHSIRDTYDQSTDVGRVIEDIDTAIRKLLEDSSSSELIDMRQSLRETVELIQNRMEAGGEIPGISTGFETLDLMTNGLQPGQLWVIGARPGVGKTALGFQLAKTCARGGNPVLFCSAEMEHYELSGRAISSESGVEGLRLLRGDLSKEDFGKISTSLAKLSTLPIHILDRAGMSIADVRIAARRSTREQGVEVIIVDYLQLLQEESGSRSREDAVRRLSNGLKNLAKELGVCIIALAQLNRRSAKNTSSDPPNLSDLRDSGSIEQDANVVLLLHRKVQADESPGDVVDVDCIVAKCRGGQIGNISMEYHSPTTHFVEREYF